MEQFFVRGSKLGSSCFPCGCSCSPCSSVHVPMDVKRMFLFSLIIVQLVEINCD